jgi:hypothetical protein
MRKRQTRRGDNVADVDGADRAEIAPARQVAMRWVCTQHADDLLQSDLSDVPRHRACTQTQICLTVAMRWCVLNMPMIGVAFSPQN